MSQILVWVGDGDDGTTIMVGKMVVAQQLTLIFILWYLYLSVGFHDKYQSYKYEKNTSGKSDGRGNGK